MFNSSAEGVTITGGGIVGNRATDISDGYGGGLACLSTLLTIQDHTIADNFANVGGVGDEGIFNTERKRVVSDRFDQTGTLLDEIDGDTCDDRQSKQR